jgi:MFS family permease
VVVFPIYTKLFTLSLVFVNFFVSLTIMPQYVLEIGGTIFQSGLQNTLFFLAAVLLRFYFGPLADRKSRKVPLLIGAFVFATAPALFLVSTSVNALMLARLYQAIGLATFLASGSSLVADLAPPGKTGTYLGVYRMLMTLSLLVGPALALSVIEGSGYDQWFALSILIGAVSFALMMLVKAPVITPVASAGSLNTSLGLLKNREIRSVFILSGITAFCYGAILTYAVSYVSLQATAANPGIFFVYFGLGGIVANLSSGYLSDLFGRKNVVLPLMMLLGIGNFVMYYISHNPSLLVAGSVMTGIGVAGSLLVLIAWLIDVTDLRNRATVLSLQESTFDLASALGPFVVGVASSSLGLAPSFLLVGVIVFAPGLFLFLRKHGNSIVKRAEL